MICKTRIVMAFAVTMMVAGAAPAQTNRAGGYSHGELRKLIHEAHTWEQYQALASYYRFQQQAYQQQAKSEITEWARRSLYVIGPASKSPRPVDSAKYRYQYFSYESQQMSRLADRYQRLAVSTTH